MLTSDQLIDRIRQINPTATNEWLNGFDSDALKRYLDHLESAMEPRGRDSVWMRPGDTTAIVRRVRSAA